jgi:hypothetical protein
MSVTDQGGSTPSSEKDVLLIVASVSMALATIALIVIVRLLERCLPDADQEESARAQEKKAIKMKELIDKHTNLLTYSQWLGKMKEKYGIPLSRSSSRMGARPEPPVATSLDSSGPSNVTISVSSTAPQPTTSQPWSEDCAVCLTEFSADERIREISYCNHAFHEECLHGWFLKSKKPVCPLCRYNLQNARIEEEEPTQSTTAAEQTTTAEQPPSASSNQIGVPSHFIMELV